MIIHASFFFAIPREMDEAENRENGAFLVTVRFSYHPDMDTANLK